MATNEPQVQVPINPLNINESDPELIKSFYKKNSVNIPADLIDENKRTLTSDEYFHVFIWSIHGGSSIKYNFHVPCEYNFNGLSLYSDALATYSLDKFNTLLGNKNSLCNLIYGNCPIIPYYVNNKKHVNVPPLFFAANPADNVDTANGNFSHYFGLYHMLIKKESSITYNKFLNSSDKNFIYQTRYGNICHQNISNVTKLYSFDDIMRDYSSSSYMFTYSELFKKVEEFCYKMFKVDNINMKDYMNKNVSLNLMVCQSLLPTAFDIKPNDRINLSYLRATLIPPYLKNTIIHNDWSSVNTSRYISLSKFMFDKTGIPNLMNYFNEERHNRKTKFVGCGLILLERFKVTSNEDTTIRLCSVSKNGTHIFDIVKYLDRMAQVHNEYSVIRYSVKDAISMLYDFFKTFNNDTFSVIKLYSDTINALKHTGHTIAIYKTNDILYLVDPQNSFFYCVNVIQQNDIAGKKQDIIYSLYDDSVMDIIKTQLFNLIDNLYYKKFTRPTSAIDLIYTIRDNITDFQVQYEPTRLAVKIDDFIELHKNSIVVVVNDPKYFTLSGGTHTKKSVRKNNSRFNVKINTRKHNPSQKYQFSQIDIPVTSLNTIYENANNTNNTNNANNTNNKNNLDEYKKIVESIDKKTHTKSILNL